MKSYVSQNRWPIGIVLVFICIAIFQFNLLSTAFEHSAISVVDDPYEVGLRYNEVVRAKMNASEVDASLSVNVEGQISVALDLKNSSDEISDMELSLKRSETEEHDQRVALTQVANSYFAQVEELKEGLWLYELRFKINGESGIQEGTLFVE